MDRLKLLERKLAREKLARETAEKLLEKKALELYLANQELQRLNNSLQEDVSKKTSELELQSTRLSTILKRLQEGILVEDADRKITLVNPTFCELFHIDASPESLIGIDCRLAMEKSKAIFMDPAAFSLKIDEILRHKKYHPAEIVKTKDGRILELSYTPVIKKEVFIGHLWRYQDKTETFLADLKIRQSEEKYRSIMENMDLGLMETNNNGTITKVYNRFCKMMGYHEEELLGKNALEVLIPDEFSGLVNQQNEMRQKGIASSYEIQMLTKSGERKWVLIGGAPFFNTSGVLDGTVGIYYDITDQKKLQSELEIARKEAEAARDAEKEFLANMSHEIRNPINAIIGMTNLLYDTHPNSDQLEYLNHINFSSELLLALVSDILDISKIAEGKMDLTLKPFNPIDLFHTIGKTMEFRLQEQPVQFDLEIDESIPSPLLGDTTFLNQILFNLLGNANKFTSHGQISFKVKLREQIDHLIWLDFIVADTGIGIPLELQEHIFERFGQAGKVKAGGGTGLGLPITKELIELMGGRISLHSTEGKGATFKFGLPFKKANNESENKEDTSKKSTPLKTLQLNILVVEDNQSNQLYLERILRKWNFKFTSCKNGAEAIKAIQKEKFDLALMDIRMPVMDGYETTVQIRASRNNPNVDIPIIALTASALLDEKEKVFAAGMNLHLTKPFTPQMLQEAIHNFFDASATLGQESAQNKWPIALSSDTLNELYEEDIDYASLMFNLFLKNIDGELTTVDQLIHRKKEAELADFLHKIKPNFSMVGLPQFSKKINELEESISQISFGKIEEKWYTLKEEILSLLPTIKAFTNQIK